MVPSPRSLRPPRLARRPPAAVSSGTSSGHADPVAPAHTGRTARRQFTHPVGKNRYVRRSKITEGSFRHFLRCFTLDMEATKIARLTHLNRNTVNRLIKGVRERIAETCEREVRAAGGGATRLSGHAAPGIGRLHRAGELAHRMVGAQVLPDGRIHTWIVPAPAASEPQQQWPPIPSAAGPAPAPQASTGASPPARQRAGADELNRARSLDSFWGQTKLRLAKFKGISRRNYYLHLKESEFRFNHRREDLYRLLLELIRKRPLF